MSLSNIKVNNQQVVSVDNEPTINSTNLIKSSGVDSAIRELTQIIIPNITGDITELLNFVNGNVVSGKSTTISYGTGTRIISNIIVN